MTGTIRETTIGESVAAARLTAANLAAARRTVAALAVATLVLVILAAAPLPAQSAPVRVEEDAPCHWDNGDRERYCEEREYRLDARSALSVDAGQNGGVAVTGWDRDEIRLIARISASSRDGDPRDLVRDVAIGTGGTIQATGPRNRRGDSWAASFDLMVPRATAVRLRASNGGIKVQELTGDVTARTTNGGITVLGGAGRVQGETTNGGVRLELTGRSWDGAGVELRTTNGGVQVSVPDDYSAELEVGTANGGMRLDIPVIVQGRIDRRIRTQLGDGGALIRATTTNGGVVVRR